MNVKQQCYFLHGSDLLQVRKALQAVEGRFLAKQDTLVDLVRFDMTETSLDTLRQAFLTIPFLGTHRLFVLRYLFGAPKAIQEGIMALLPQVGDSTLVVIYEPTRVDRRLSLFKWLQENAKSQEFSIPEGAALANWANQQAQELGITIAPPARAALAHYFNESTWQLAEEVKKLALYVLSKQRSIVEMSDVALLCNKPPEDTVFQLTDAIRDAKISRAMQILKRLIEREEPLLIGGAIASQIRSLTKIFLCVEKGTRQQAEIARMTRLNPYVVKLAYPVAAGLSQAGVKESYRTLCRFDTSVKEGIIAPSLGLSLLVLRLCDHLGE